MGFYLRLARIGLVVALAVGLSGWGFERIRFGASDQSALARVDRELRQRLDLSARTLATIADRVAGERDRIRVAPRDPAAAKRLFDVADEALAGQDTTRAGITIYNSDGTPLAWAGRVSDQPLERIVGPPALFVETSRFGPRLVRIEPVIDPTERVHPLVHPAVVVEQGLGTETTPGVGDTFTIPTSIVPVTLRAQTSDAPGLATHDPYTLIVPVGSDGLLIEAYVSPSDLHDARASWQRAIWAAVVLIGGLVILLGVGPLLERRRRIHQTPTFLMTTFGIAAIVFAAFMLFSFAARGLTESDAVAAPVVLLLAALGALAIVRLALDLEERLRLSRPRAPIVVPTFSSVLLVFVPYAASGILSFWLLRSYEHFLDATVSGSTLDLLHFSLHPLSASRLMVAFALVVLHATVIWAAAILTLLPGALFRMVRTIPWRVVVWSAWLTGLLLATGAAYLDRSTGPLVPLWMAVVGAAALGGALSQTRGRLRRASQAARLSVLFLALLVPAIVMYPSLFVLTRTAKEHLIETQYGPQARSQREELQGHLQSTVEQIDSLGSLAPFVSGPDIEARSSDRGFFVWKQTDLSKYRLTSAVELYGADGALISRFALVPEYASQRFQARGCRWDEPFDEVAPFGSSEQLVLRTSRGICERGRQVGSVVVRVMLDYRTLPFISSGSPYLESLRMNRAAPPEGAAARDVEFVVYGWSRAPNFESGTKVWTLSDAVFQQTVESRTPFWTAIDRGDVTFRVYLLNDRGGIYALGYPVISLFGHLVNLAELIMLAFVLYVAMVLGATVFNVLTLGTPASGRELLREVRSSFYRKLLLMFLAGAVVPVVILAFATRTYFARQLRAGAEDTAARTVTTAQRLVEDYATLQSVRALDDQIMALVRRAIDEDVNLFLRERLQATSAPDLFASQLLSTRTPGDVYRAILLDREPIYIGDEVVGDFHYRAAAAPVRIGGRESIVTVPLTNRQQEIEQQIDELDRRVVSAAVLFSLLGALLGYWMAERIADPVNRLTRATRRIARGDLDARVAATSSDELRRLVEDFNQMAADLKRQRSELERTQRLEAWADMARQVAHDIKNPLTPIQLSAEHARRVNQDRGRPLSPVLDECVAAILTQVKLLRQISVEFSSFASSPTPRPEPTSIPAIVEEVVEPYRTGLAGRIRVDVNAPTTLPELRIDRMLFARALTNVIENALHAMPGQGTLTISSHETNHQPSDRRSVVVEISDTGVGMDQEALNRIFEPYFSTKATGTGLGLTIAKRNIELNGGTIAVRSQRGSGTTVTFTLTTDVT